MNDVVKYLVRDYKVIKKNYIYIDIEFNYFLLLLLLLLLLELFPYIC